MMDGIDYYPRQRKGKIKFKFLLIFLLVIVMLSYWYFESKQQRVESNSELIVIKEPKSKNVINAKPVVIEEFNDWSKEPEILENLDEVMQIYNKNNQ